MNKYTEKRIKVPRSARNERWRYAGTVSVSATAVTATSNDGNYLTRPEFYDLFGVTSDDAILAKKALSVNGDLEVGGTATVNEQLAVDGAADIGGALSVGDKATVSGAATFGSSVQFGPSFASGQTGVGGRIDANANAELQSLALRSWLEVPEIRYNRAEVLLGDQWQAPGGGIVESVTQSTATTGIVTLKLEEGEIGAVAVGDLCKGYYHAASGNAASDTDDSRGNSTFAGFCTVFFKVTQVSGDSSSFEYEIRPTSARWSSTHHPFVGMHFVAYGNATNSSRQKSAYQTRTYARYLTGVNDWEFTADNIAMQFGDLSNLSVFGLSMSGYSAYLNNIYMSGVIAQATYRPELVISPASVTYNPSNASPISLTAFITDGISNFAPDTLTAKVTSSGESWATGTAKQSLYLTYAKGSSAWSVSIIPQTLSSFSGSVTFTATYNGKTYEARLSIARAADGANGSVYRKTQWATGRTYNDGTVSEGGVKYIDMVYATDTAGQVSGLWQCKAAHTSSSSASLPAANESNTYWQAFNMLTAPIYTSLIMAPGAVIGLMQGNELKIYDANGNLKAGVSSANPLIYANPQTYVTAATVQLATSSSASESQTFYWTSSVSVANNAYLHFRFNLTLSDGSTKIVTRIGRWQNTTGSSKTCNNASLLYYPDSVSASTSAPVGTDSKWETVPHCTSVGKPYLWACVKFSRGGAITRAGAYLIYTQAAGDMPSNATYQQSNNGDALFGMPSGASVRVVAAPSSGSLPRIEVRDQSGTPSLVIDGSATYSVSDIFGAAGSSAQSLTATSVTTDAATSVSSASTVTATSDALTLTCATDATLRLSANAITAYGASGSEPSEYSGFLAQQSATAELLLDGQPIATARLTFNAYGVSVSAAAGATSSYGETAVPISAGTHTLAIRATFLGYSGGYAAAQLASAQTATLIVERRLCKHFANGLIVGTATDNYFMAWTDEDDCVNFTAINSNGAGLRLTPDAAQVRRVGSSTWTNL